MGSTVGQSYMRKEPVTMKNTRFVGLDVHAATIAEARGRGPVVGNPPWCPPGGAARGGGGTSAAGAGRGADPARPGSCCVVQGPATGNLARTGTRGPQRRGSDLTSPPARLISGCPVEFPLDPWVQFRTDHATSGESPGI